MESAMAIGRNDGKMEKKRIGKMGIHFPSFLKIKANKIPVFINIWREIL
jgi:hypothetical protein